MNQYDAERANALLSAKMERTLAREYEQTRKSIKSKMAELYEKYAIKGELTHAEMSKYNRMKQMTDFIDMEIKDLTGRVNNEIKPYVKNIYEQSYYNYTTVINGQAQTELNWGVLNRDMIASIVSEPSVSGMSLGQLLDRNRYMTLLQERQIITQGLKQGLGFQEMARNISKSFDKAFNQALTVARTEGTRAAGEGQSLAYDRAENLGIELKRIWSASPTGSDARHYKAGLNGMVADSEGYFHRFGSQTKYPGGWGIPGQDINCFPGNVIPAVNSKILKGYRRWFDGDLYTITTAGGNQITGTPNHPILTDKGFIPFNQIDNSTNLICTSGNIKGLAPAPDIYRKPTRFAEIFNFLYIGFPSYRKTGMNKDFHGDGTNSNIDIVYIDSLLSDRIKTFIFKRFNKFIFKLSNFRKRFLDSYSSFNHSRFWLFRTANGIMGFLSKSFSFARKCLFHSYIHGFASITRFISNFIKRIADRSPTISEYFRKFFNRFTGFMFFDKPVSIKVNPFHGYVYNLQTKNNKYFVTDNIKNNSNNVNYFIVHNCRCRIRSEVVLPEE